MASSRLPGKVLKPASGRPLLYYMVERLKWIPEISQIVIATSTNPQDHPIEDFCRLEEVNCYRGSEDDVLQRIAGAANQFYANPIMRLTADCPLLDIDTLSYQAKFFEKCDLDYCYLGLSFPEGLCADIFTLEALNLANRNAIAQSEREHVTPYFHNNKGQFRLRGLENTTDDSKYRFVVDQPEDFSVVSQIIERLYQPKTKPFGVEEIKNFLDTHPEIFKLNCDVIRNESYDVFNTSGK